MDNSCGDGAFLCEVVRRYCEASIKSNRDADTIRHDLETYIHGIELDFEAVSKCISNLNNVINELNSILASSSQSSANIRKNKSSPPPNNKDSDVKKCRLPDNVKWDIKCGDALVLGVNYFGKMDYVVGNPPYVRVHHLSAITKNLDKSGVIWSGSDYDAVKQFCFAQRGMTDLYIVFFELGIKMLNPRGTLGLITPSSYFNSKAGTKFREYIRKHRVLNAVVDLQHFKPFNQINSYTAITIIDNKWLPIGLDSVKYFRYDSDTLSPVFIADISYEDIFINKGNMYLSKPEGLELLKDVEEFANANKNNENGCKITVKNGLATLADAIFIKSEVDFRSELGDYEFEKLYTNNHIINVVKGSTGKFYKSIFPYYDYNKPLSENYISEEYPKLYRYLLKHKPKLMQRDIARIFENVDDSWFLFGRTQGMRDVFSSKIVVNNMVKTINDIKVVEASVGVGVYSGFYAMFECEFPADACNSSKPATSLVTSNSSSQKRCSIVDVVRDILCTDEFISYVAALSRYKNNGYYTFSSIELQHFLLYRCRF